MVISIILVAPDDHCMVQDNHYQSTAVDVDDFSWHLKAFFVVMQFATRCQALRKFNLTLSTPMNNLSHEVQDRWR